MIPRRSTPTERKLVLVLLALALTVPGLGLIAVGALAGVKLGEEAAPRMMAVGVLLLLMGAMGVPLFFRWARR
jgi:hypothetical protein